jgi:hypothetical protein
LLATDWEDGTFSVRFIRYPEDTEEMDKDSWWEDDNNVQEFFIGEVEEFIEYCETELPDVLERLKHNYY